MTARRIVRDQRVVDDDWTRVDDDAPVPPAGRVIVTHARWLAERDALKARGDVGIQIPSDLDVHTLAGDLDGLGVIVIPFVFIQPRPEGGKTFDGRGYSQARLLRERLGYAGEIRATGDVFRDAIHPMRRCGINAFEPRPGLDPEDALRAFGDFTTAYQGAADGEPVFFRRRRPDPA